MFIYTCASDTPQQQRNCIAKVSVLFYSATTEGLLIVWQYIARDSETCPCLQVAVDAVDDSAAVVVMFYKWRTHPLLPCWQCVPCCCVLCEGLMRSADLVC
jgi:hypothetical protein